MDWRNTYKERTTSAEEAVNKIKSGDRVYVAHACGEPHHLMDAMVANHENYSNVEVFIMVSHSACEFAQEGMEPHFRLSSTFLTAKSRDSVKRGHGDFIPCFFYMAPYVFDSMRDVDVAMVQVSPPDRHGYCSLGVSVDCSKMAVENAKMVIVQVNDQMPRTHGDCFIHVDKIDCFVEHSAPIVELPPPKISEVERSIGENCAQFINDGDTLQLGIGAIPDAVLLFLDDKKHLGIHSEMFSDGVVELVEKGVVDNSQKTLHRDKFVSAFLMGTRRLYDFVDDNPMVYMAPVNYTNDPSVIALNDNMVSINSCLEVDFMGQVCAEAIGTSQFTGVGGQVDYVRGATMSKGGRSIIAMPSTAAKGTLSRIVPQFGAGTPVTTSRNEVQYIVTEYGAAELRGHSIRERARSLIKIAHPKFREELEFEFKKNFSE